MATSFEPLNRDQSSSKQNDWISILRSGAGFVERDWHSHDPKTASAPGTDEVLEEAFRNGEIAGRLAAETELQEAQASQSKFKVALEGLNTISEQALVAALADTVATICEQVIEPALVDRDALNARCETAIAKLGEAPNRLALHLHPDDAELLDAPIKDGLRLVPDANLARGAIRLEGPEGLVSDQPEDWRKILREALTP